MPHEPCKISVQKFRSPGGSADILEKRMGGINPIHLHWRWQTPRWVFKQPSPSCGREGGGQNDQSLLTQNIRGIERRGKSLQLLSMSTFKSISVIFRSVQYWGHQRSSNVKWNPIFLQKCVIISETIMGKRTRKHSIALELLFRLTLSGVRWTSIRL